MSDSTSAVHHYEALFAARPSDGEPAWLESRRAEAMQSFAELGFPTRKLEEWRYIDLGAIAKSVFSPAEHDSSLSPKALADISTPEDEAFCAVFVDGVLDQALSKLPDDDTGPRFYSLRSACEGGEGHALIEQHLGRYADFKEDAFTALNTALVDDGAVVEIPARTQAPGALRILFVSTGDRTLSQPRVLVVARESSEAALCVHFASLGDGAQLCNAVVEVVLEANAQLELLTLQAQNERALLVTNTQVSQERDSRFGSHCITLGGALCRNELDTVLAGAGAFARLNGLFLGTDAQQLDNHTLVDHAMPHCTSEELYKGVLADTSRGVFRGRVLVRPGAQKTDAQQSNPNLILSNKAEIDTKPQLEIYADDVKCCHGATVGQLDEDALFFMRSRGLGAEEARALLTRGFAHEISDALPRESWVAWTTALVHDRLVALFDGRSGDG
jgi:Fe-S cluster assembly protein SufD